MNKKLITHPLMQLFSFSIILIGSPSFAGPYLLFVFGAGLTGIAFGWVGILAILLTATSLYQPIRKLLQPLGLLTMWISLGIYYKQAPEENIQETTAHILPMLTVIWFILISVMILFKHFYYDYKTR